MILALSKEMQKQMKEFCDALESNKKTFPEKELEQLLNTSEKLCKSDDMKALRENPEETERLLKELEVKENENYALVISTNGGLWRYIIGDTIRFTSVRPYRIMITGRTKHFLNAFGEEVIIDNAEKALEEACRRTGVVINEYTVAPVFMDANRKARHEWCIEFAKDPVDLEKFTDLLDKSLMAVNSDYEAKRFKDITLGPPLVHAVKQGTFLQWFHHHNKVGGQNKIPRLSNNRRFVEEILKIDEEMKKL